MPLGIRPINDFAFKKTFGTAENRVALISLLNAILRPKSAIVEVTLELHIIFYRCIFDFVQAKGHQTDPLKHLGVPVYLTNRPRKPLFQELLGSHPRLFRARRSLTSPSRPGSVSILTSNEEVR